MQIIIGNEIRVKEPTKPLHHWCKDNLVLRNPEYDKRARRGLWLGNTPEYIWLYWVDGSDLMLPTVTGKQLRQYMGPGDTVQVELDDNGLLD